MLSRLARTRAAMPECALIKISLAYIFPDRLCRVQQCVNVHRPNFQIEGFSITLVDIRKDAQPCVPTGETDIDRSIRGRRSGLFVFLVIFLALLFPLFGIKIRHMLVGIPGWAVIVLVIGRTFGQLDGLGDDVCVFNGFQEMPHTV